MCGVHAGKVRGVEEIHVNLRLDPNGIIDPVTITQSLRLHAIPGAELYDDANYSRLIGTTEGPRKVEIRLSADVVHAAVDAEPHLTDELVAAIRFWLDLDTDLGPVVAHLSADERLRPLTTARPALRVVRWPDLFEGIILTVIGQQVTLAASRTFGGRLVRAYGDLQACGLTAFPMPGLLAAVPVEDLQRAVGLTKSRARTVAAAAQAYLADSRLRQRSDGAAFREALLQIHGVGPWTADYLMVRGFGHPDSFTPTDAVARRALGGPAADDASHIARRWSPYRSYALSHLWAAELDSAKSS